MLNDIRYIRGQLRALVQVGNDCSPAECADRIGRALDALERLQSQAQEADNVRAAAENVCTIDDNDSASSDDLWNAIAALRSLIGSN